MNNKIYSLPTLSRIRKSLSNVVLSHGTFDLIHSGHLEHFRQAKAMGKYLIVTLTGDNYVAKGPNRPFLSQEKRAEYIAMLDCVDFVAVVEEPTALSALQALRPDILCRGEEYKEKQNPTWLKEKAAVLEYGGVIGYTDGFIHSSSRIINEEYSAYPPKVEEYLRGIRAKYQQGDIKRWLDDCEPFRCLVLGEHIRDNYIFVTPEGKSRKDSLVTFRQTGQASYNGGAAIIHESLSRICPSSTLAGTTGWIDKTRYVTLPYYQKLFAVASGEIEPFMILPMSAKDMDMIISADFGNGFFADVIEDICRTGIFIALSVQTNSLNFGFNLASKWPRADFLLLDEEELRLNMRDKVKPLIDLAQMQRGQIGAKYVAITRGHEGCLMVSENEIAEAPALATKVVDRLGSGDAFFAVAAPLARAGAPADVIAFVGNIAAGISVGKLGNVATEKEEILKWATSLLK